ncbi:MAG: transposase [Meiothermus silvanus]|nr:transposase [Allomeiothermus silvanus]
MTRTHARSVKGQRSRRTMIRKRGDSTTTLGAICLTQVQAAFIFAGATDASAFMTCITEMLLLTLWPGQIVVMVNLEAHQVKAVRETIKTAGSTLKNTPPYSPEQGPIEECWSRVKAINRREDQKRSIASRPHRP